MDSPPRNVTHNCERFCKVPCSDFTLNSPLNRECLAAVVNCKCRPIWKDPAFWLIGGLVFAVVVTIVRFIYMHLKEKKAKKAASAVVNASRDTNASETTNTTKPVPKSEPPTRPATSQLTPAQAIVVESSVVENQF